VYYAADVEHIAEHLKWTLKRIDIPFTARDEETMVELENELTAGTVPFAQTQKAITQRVQQSKFCQMLSPIFGPVLHPLYKRNMGCTMFPFFLTVSPRDAVIPSILCMFVAGSIGAGIKQIWRAPRPFYIRPDLLKKGYESWGYSSPCEQSPHFMSTHPGCWLLAAAGCCCCCCCCCCCRRRRRRRRCCRLLLLLLAAGCWLLAAGCWLLLLTHPRISRADRLTD
jgi:hypothetical protein